MSNYVITFCGRAAGIDRRSDTMVKMTNLEPDGLITRRLQIGSVDVQRNSDDEGH